MAASQSTMDKLYGMRLSVMAQAYRDQEESPGVADMTFDERLAMIVDAEWDARRVNKRTRLLRQAGFPEPEANVTDVHYDPDRKLDKVKMTELSNCEWIRNHRNVLLTGASGAGKSWIASALGVAACNAFFSVRYVRLPEMLDELAKMFPDLWVAEDEEEVPQVRFAHLGRLASREDQRQAGARAAGNRGGKATNGLSAHLLPVLAGRMACEAGRRRDSRCGH